MILKEIYLYPEILDYREEITFLFKKQSRSLCNYIERYLKAVKYQTDDFKRICFVCQKEPLSNTYINTCNVLCVSIPMSQDEYTNKKKEFLNEYFISLLMLGMDKCNETHPLPSDIIIAAINEFRREGYINEWVFKKKKLKELGLEFILKCSLTMDEFSLDLHVAKEKNIIYRDNIIKDIPNEFVFNYHLKDLLITNDNIKVIDKLNKEIYSKNIDEIIAS
ncbi:MULTISPECIES: hypothetical protein [Enterobacterales]|uniref:hypothetical protein n=1 Tax=Enterobacterales TaxID=91347 RepID=UPI002ED7EFF3